MRTLLISAAAATLAACATPLPPPIIPPRDGPPAHGSFGPAQARALTEADLTAVLGAAVADEARRAGTSVIVRRGVSLPRMIQQPDGSWKPEGPYANAAVRTSAGWVGWPGGQRSLLAPETSRELDRLLASPALWAEPALDPVTCTDAGGLMSVVRHNGRERVASQPCGTHDLTGRLAEIVMAGRVNDWAGTPPGAQPAGIPLGRFDGAIPTHYQYSSALRDPLNLTIRSQSEWDGIWRRLTANQGPPTLPPGVNFERDMLLISAMGAKPTGGYTIRIERVIDSRFELEAHVVRTSPGPRCGTIAAVTHPVDIVTVPFSHKQVRWVMRDEVTDCP
jgi:hypothetical protein